MMMNSVSNFAHANVFYLYLFLNLVFYTVSKIYHNKYKNDKNTGYKKDIDGNVASIFLMTNEYVIRVGFIPFLVIYILTYRLSKKFNFDNRNKSRIMLILAGFIIFIVILFAYFPILLFTSFIGLFLKFEAVDTEK